MAHQHKRSIESVLPDLIAVLSSWNLGISDWIIALHYAEILQGYTITKSLRPGHINILVRASKLPWKTPKKLLGVEAIIPASSDYERDFISFQRRTGFDFDLIPYDDTSFDRSLTSSALDYSNGDVVCKMLSVEGSVDYLTRTLALGKEKIGEKIKRILVHLKEIADSATKLGETRIQKRSERLLRKSEPLLADEGRPDHDSNVLRGSVVFGGKVTGKVFLVKHFDKSLAKTNTIAHRVLVCQKVSKRIIMHVPQVAAIVTDDGGMLSHAAIIAREMKKPCVIGTKIATQVLKHGETVRVDAAKGTITRVGAVKRHRSNAR